MKKDKKSISGDTITNFLLPLATCYLFNEEYAKHNHLIDAALECLQAVARCLSWQNYEKLLRFYLANMTRQLEFQKQAVKAVVAILNAFHFDLTNSKFKSYYAAKAEERKEAQSLVSPDAVEKAPIAENVELDKAQEETESKEDAAAVVDTIPELPEMGQEEETTPSIDEQLATKIHSVIAQQLLPDLNTILTARSNREKQHKSVKQDHYAEDDEILRVPIALALVNLLKNLPTGSLQRNLPGYQISIKGIKNLK